MLGFGKKKENTIGNEAKVDDDLDELNFDFDEPKIKDDRKPATKVAVGAIRGVKDHLKSSSFIKEALKETMPNGFGNTLDFALNAKESIKNTYDESIADIKPMYRQAKVSITKLIPPDSKVLPKFLSKKFSQWKEQEAEESKYEKGNDKSTIKREDSLADTMKQVFETQTELQMQQRGVEQGEKRLKEGVEFVRHKNLLSALNQTSVSVSRLDNYQTKITNSYQRKSLELKFRQLFATQDLLTHFKEDAIKRDALLTSINKNTGLPEFVKIQDGEMKKQIAKSKLFDAINSGMYGDRNKFIGDIFGKLKKNLTEQIKSGMAGLQEGLSSVEMAHDMTDGMGIDHLKELGAGIGGAGLGMITAPIGNAIRNKIVGSKLDKRFGISDKAHKANTMLTQMPEHINEFRKSNAFINNDGPFGKLMSAIQGIIPGMGIDKTLASKTGKNMDEPFHFTRHADRSLNTIIPGFLARIYREIQVFRTGNDKIQITKFDHDSGKFMGSDKLVAKALERIAPAKNAKYLKYDLDRMMEEIDPENKLSEEEKSALRKHLVVNSSKTNYANKERLGTANQYKNVNKHTANKLAAHMSNYIDNLTPEKENEFKQRHGKLKENIAHPGQIIQEYLDLGQKDILVKLGVLEKDGVTINADRLLEYTLDHTRNEKKVIPTKDSSDGLSSTALTKTLIKANDHVEKHIKKAKAYKDNLLNKAADSKVGKKARSYHGKIKGHVKEVEKQVSENANKLYDDVTYHYNNGTLDKYIKTELESATNSKVGKKARAYHGKIKGHVKEVGTKVSKSANKLYDDVTYHYNNGTLDKYIKTELASAANTVKSNATEGINFIKENATKDKLLSAANNIKTSAQEIMADIFVAGEKTPRLKDILLKQGEYINKATGKVITNIKDITGEVIEKTSKRIVISKEDISKLVYYDQFDKQVKNIKNIGNIANNYLTNKANELKAHGTKLFTEAKATFKKEFFKDNRPKDIYVEGEEEARVTGVGMEQGEYFDAETGDPIKSEKDITGTVKNSEGKIVIESKDLPRLRFWNIELRRWSPLWIGKKILGGLWHYQTKIAPKWAAANLRFLWKATKFIAGGTIKALGVGLGKLGIKIKKPKDVYIKGKGSEPVLIGTKIQAGHYANRDTMKPFYHENDIDGPVIDIATKQTLIDVDELDKLYTIEGWMNKYNPLKLVRWLVKAPFRLAGFIGKSAMDFTFKKAPDLAMKGLKTLGKIAAFTTKVSMVALGLRLKPQDIFVAGTDHKTPTLSGVRMKQGKYVSVNSEKTIYSPNDIDGPIRDIDTKQIVLTEEDFKNGLFTVDGNKVKHKLGLVGNLGVGIKKIGSGIKTLGRLANFDVKTNLKVKHTKKDTPTSLGEVATIKTATTLDTILQVITKWRDKDKIRKGSYEDEMNNESKEKAETEKSKTAKSDKIGIGGMFGLGGKDKKDTEEKEESGGIVSEGKRYLEDKLIDRVLGRGGKIAKSTGRFGARMLSKIPALGRLAKYGVAGAEAAGAAGVGAGALGTAGAATGAMGAIGGIARGAGALVGKLALPLTAGISAVSGIMDESKGKHIDSISDVVPEGFWGKVNPFEWAMNGGRYVGNKFNKVTGAIGGALGIGSLGGGIYNLFHKKYDPNKYTPEELAAIKAAKIRGSLQNANTAAVNLTPLSKLRMVQYGFTSNDSDNISKIIQVENYLNDLTSISNGDVKLDNQKLEMSKMISMFGLDPSNMKDVKMYFDWFKERFKPVYSVHMAAINALGKKNLNEVNNLKKEEKLQYFKAVKFTDGPYSFIALPVKDKEVPVATAKEVTEATRIAEEDLKNDDKVINKEPNKVGLVTAGITKAVLPDAQTTELTPSNYASKAGAGSVKIPGDMYTALSTVGAQTLSDGSNVNAFDTIRFKTYGLNKIEPDKIKSIKLLEKTILEQVNYDGSGVAQWKGNPLEILNDLTGVFGIATLLSKESSVWVTWFNKRFLPIYLAYLSGIKVFTGKVLSGDPSTMLKPQQLVELSKSIIGLNNIWSITDTPWPKYVMNTNAKSVEENLAFLQLLVKDVIVQEQKANVPDNNLKSNIKPTVNTVLPNLSNNANINKADTPSLPDAETNVKSSGSIGSNNFTNLSSGLVLANGPIYDGRNASGYLSLGQNVTLDNLNPAVKSNFLGMVEEYGTMTGKKVQVNDGFRTSERQAELKAKYGARAAAPGSSLHEFGLALDVNSKTLDEMEKLGLMRKYGFTRPVGAEPWHMEPIGIQSDLNRFKSDASAAAEAVKAGIGKGGGGIGIATNAIPYSRDRESSLAIMSASVNATDNKPINAQTTTVAGGENPGYFSTIKSNIASPSFSSKSIALDGSSNSTGSMDSETKPMGSSRNINIGNSTGGNLFSANNNVSADPTVKVPDPKGNNVDGMRDTITAAAKLVGVDPNTSMSVASIESDFNPNAQANTSSASGLFQFTKDTWSAMISKYGKKYGYDVNTLPTDAKAASIMGAHYIKEINDTISKKTRRAIGAVETYLGHFLGPTDAGEFLANLDSNPNNPADVMKKAANANKSIFYNGNQPRTFSEVYSLLASRIRDKAKKYGIDLPIPTGGTNNSTSISNGGINGQVLGGDAGNTPTNTPISGQVLGGNAIPPNRQSIPSPTVGPMAMGLRAGNGGINGYPNGQQITSNERLISVGNNNDISNNNTSSNPSNFASIPSMSNAYGMGKPIDALNVSPGYKAPIDKSMLDDTNGILNKQLEVQNGILKLLGKVLDNLESDNEDDEDDNNQTTSNKAGTRPESTPYQIPKAKISMKRVGQ